MYANGMIAPVLALVAWTLVMWIWMYVTRIPAMQRANVDLDEVRRSGKLPTLPPEVERVAANYNHLHEQPTLFYALALAAHLAGVTDGIAIGLAWTYVVLRIVHSVLQATVNIIPMRFTVFTLATLVLVALLVRTVLAL